MSDRTTSAARLGVLLLTLVGAVVTPVAGEATRVEIGRSVEDRPIHVEVFGEGQVDVLLVGGIHGGYEANSIVLARRFAEWYREKPARLPDHVTLHIVDTMNPDGLHRVTGGADAATFDFRSVNTRPGRFNANGVDLNRNWDATWRPESTWGTVVVSAGAAPFSEPETRAVRDYVLAVDPVASVFFQSAGGFLWYSGAEEGWAASRRLAEVYGRASGYRVARPPIRDPSDADDDDITASADDWLDRINRIVTPLRLEESLSNHGNLARTR